MEELMDNQGANPKVDVSEAVCPVYVKVPLKYRKTRELTMTIVIFCGWLYAIFLNPLAHGYPMHEVSPGDIILFYLYTPFLIVVFYCFDGVLKLLGWDEFVPFIWLLGFCMSYLVAKLFYLMNHRERAFPTGKRDKI
jgi:hypothetical protein